MRARVKRALREERKGVSAVESYNELPVKKTLLITEKQDRKLKVFCKVNRISVSQLFRFFVDELNMSCNPAYAEQLRYNISGGAFKTQNFVGGFDPAGQSEEAVYDERTGARQQRFWNTGTMYQHGPR